MCALDNHVEGEIKSWLGVAFDNKYKIELINAEFVGRFDTQE
ncbi:hypothetical protein PRVXH_000314 [Proteinivorax hydrogeniformans]|uniref:Uncharacterized protein n=1 Tax=Proteinivorax hydrogeniformans TaxID=1826727 RepID=A0AAU8HUF0_9FIRM